MGVGGAGPRASTAAMLREADGRALLSAWQCLLQLLLGAPRTHSASQCTRRPLQARRVRGASSRAPLSHGSHRRAIGDRREGRGGPVATTVTPSVRLNSERIEATPTRGGRTRQGRDDDSQAMHAWCMAQTPRPLRCSPLCCFCLPLSPPRSFAMVNGTCTIHAKKCQTRHTAKGDTAKRGEWGQAGVGARRLTCSRLLRPTGVCCDRPQGSVVPTAASNATTPACKMRSPRY